jgi:hypothetical protein
MTLECINPDDLPTPRRTPTSVLATWQSKPGGCSPTSAVLSMPPALGLRT